MGSSVPRPVVPDAGYLIAVCDPDDPTHGHARERLARLIGSGRSLVVPATVYCEAMAAARLTDPHSVRVLDGLMDGLATVQVIDRDVARASAEWCASYGPMSLRRGLVLGTATIAEAEDILTGDEHLHALDLRRLAAWSR
jgi:hypothetical protein